jgi:hypothetical protein
MPEFGLSWLQKWAQVLFTAHEGVNVSRSVEYQTNFRPTSTAYIVAT